jgi:anti-anti-sigma factor
MPTVRPVVDPLRTPAATVRLRWTDSETAIVELDGDHDVATAWALRESVDAAIAGRPHRLVVDLRRAGFIDVLSLRELVRAQVRVAAPRSGERQLADQSAAYWASPPICSHRLACEAGSSPEAWRSHAIGT